VTAHEVVIRFSRPFSIAIRGEFRSATEVTIPFTDRGSALAASLEVTVTVRPVHDAGGEDYRPVVAGEVIPDRRPRLKACVERWPDCSTGGYDPACCRFPKSCSADIYYGESTGPADLEGAAVPDD
jgi:hypothetical protein